ncbi:hypothetical protein VTL71DRAFT_14933 [Oculimacula yallundae]|uniref:Uncharacterized protein n=1 Tax=Oculimacula yallundae TaxID=86028 RepID=A0ABR4CH80_9HELO
METKMEICFEVYPTMDSNADAPGAGEKQRAGIKNNYKKTTHCNENISQGPTVIISKAVPDTMTVTLPKVEARMPVSRNPFLTKVAPKAMPVTVPVVKARMPQPIYQPILDPSPSVRKSVITDKVEVQMDTLGQANRHRFKDFSAKEEERVYSGNPFAKILRSRGRTSGLRPTNDLSDFQDIPAQSVKKSDDFVQISTTYQEELVILMSKEDPSKPLDAPGQPAYIRVPLLPLRRSDNILAKLLLEKDKKVSKYKDSSVVYSFDKDPQPNIHIQEYAIYIDGLLAYGFKARGYNSPHILTTEQLWVGFRFWGAWISSNSFKYKYEMLESACEKDNLESAIQVVQCLEDPVYAKEVSDIFAVLQNQEHSDSDARRFQTLHVKLRMFVLQCEEAKNLLEFKKLGDAID